jgi:hypothetical protein
LKAGLFAVAIFSSSAPCDVPEESRHEVLHLLEFLHISGCTVERNGQQHYSESAYRHVKRKYEHFRDKIMTSEDFVEYSASKSMMSGEYYLVSCAGEPEVRTQDWLLEELRRYRGRGQD